MSKSESPEKGETGEKLNSSRDATVGNEVSGSSAGENVAGSNSGLQAELEQSKKDYMYLAAEFENYKRHAIRERSDLAKYGAERFIRELLDVLDNFERALGSELNESNVQSFKDGVSLIHRELTALLQKHNVQELMAEGQLFDPSVHEALTSEPSTAVEPGRITRVFRKAYKLYDRLLRPAQVVVAIAPTEGSGT